MTQKECEQAILKKLEEIANIYRTYNPDGTYLSMALVNGEITVNNEYWEDGEDENKPIDAIRDLFKEE